MADGTISGKMDKALIDNGILVEGEITNPSHGIIELNKWAIPHWDWVIKSRIGAIKVNKVTAEYLISRLKEILPGQRHQA